MFENRLIAKNALFKKIKQWPLKSERGEVFEPISSDARQRRVFVIKYILSCSLTSILYDYYIISKFV